MQTIWQKLERFSYMLAPMVVTACMALLASVRLHVPGLSEVMPAFVLINIYFWCLFCPGSLPYWFLFALGLVQDTLAGLPPGVTSLGNIVFVFLINAERHAFGKMLFGSVWFGFCVLSFSVFALEWVTLSLYSRLFLPPVSLLFPWAATCLAYPLMHVMLTHFYSRNFRV